jgi:glutathione S-transferase
MRLLYVREGSVACQIVRWVLARKRLDYERVEVDARLGAHLLRRFQTDEVPLLEDDGQAIVGARPIVFYLERTAGPPSVFPADPQKRNQAVTLAEFAEKVIGPLILAAEQGGGEELSRLRAQLGHVREAIGRRALDSGSCHFGDLSVAAHLEACRGLRGLDFARDYADLAAFIERVRPGRGEP